MSETEKLFLQALKAALSNETITWGRDGDLRELGKAMTAALSGRGGGKPVCQQGKVSATEEEIRRFFAGK